MQFQTPEEFTRNITSLVRLQHWSYISRASTGNNCIWIMEKVMQYLQT
ncbi:hypothetical protein MtrunA17_Chr5g0446331 [Medicago truncatula]|uniref:Uncharacterized protein n=1 Tax=Medicago truncatula TaxID=3880 RepID=A0A396HXD1_MEDTR|nr:hypothetical protein MtrunA17_Chr5g0446331 [Medicago truncatula]